MKIQKRRRRKYKTDYKTRVNLLKKGIPRIVIRKTNKYITAQYVESKKAQDKILIGVSSRDLLKYGWPKEAVGSLKSIPASYLTGVLLGTKIKKLKTTKEKEKSLEKIESLLDIGLLRNKPKGRIYAVLKGLVDFEIKINHKKESLPEEKKVLGENLKNKIDIQKIKNKIIE